MALAEALENIVPDRLHAIEMYLVAWKAAHRDVQALHRARELAVEIGNQALAARIARQGYKHTKDPKLLLEEGILWLDSETPDNAIKPLMLAKRKLPTDSDVENALAAARREWPNPRETVQTLVQRAGDEVDVVASGELYLQAARILDLLGTNQVDYLKLLTRSFQVDPRNPHAFARFVSALAKAGAWQGLAEVLNRRGAASQSATEMVEIYRRAATNVILQHRQYDLGVQLLQRGLEMACYHGIGEFSGMAAMLTLLRAEWDTDSQLEAIEPIYKNLFNMKLSEDDKLWLSIDGLDVCWNRLRSPATAARFARYLRDKCPEHPMLADYSGGGAALGDLVDQGRVVLANNGRGTGPAPALDLPPPEPIEVGFELPEPESQYDHGAIPLPEIEEPAELLPTALVADDESALPEPLPPAPMVPPPSPPPSAPMVPPPSPPPIAATPPAIPVKAAPATPPPMSIIPKAAMAALDKRRPAVDDDRRRAQRHDLIVEIELIDSDRVINGTTKNVSKTGALVACNETLTVPSVVTLRIAFPGDGGLSIQTVRAEIVRAEPNVGYGVQFLLPTPDFNDALVAHLSRLLLK
jgi:hypothetical protein